MFIEMGEGPNGEVHDTDDFTEGDDELNDRNDLTLEAINKDFPPLISDGDDMKKRFEDKIIDDITTNIRVKKKPGFSFL